MWLSAGLKACLDNQAAKSNVYVHRSGQTARHLRGVHALRGIAALMVVAFHLVHLTNLNHPATISFIGEYGGMGVYLFFVISGFTLLHSHVHQGCPTGWIGAFCIKRLFRILPLYYSCVLFYVFYFFPYQFPRPIDPVDILTEVLFLRALLGTEMNSIVWAGWTVQAEMVFYAILPLLLVGLRNVLAIVAFCLALFGVSILARMPLVDGSPPLSSNFQILKYGYVFVFGWVAYLAFPRMCATSDNVVRVVAWLTMLLLAVAAITPREAMGGYTGVEIFVGSSLFALLVLTQAARPFLLLNNRLLDYIGERSYSIYLLHAPTIVIVAPLARKVYNASFPLIGSYAFLVALCLIVLVVMVLSELTYRFIEAPGMRLGRLILKHRKIRLTEQSTS